MTKQEALGVRHKRGFALSNSAIFQPTFINTHQPETLYVKTLPMKVQASHSVARRIIPLPKLQARISGMAGKVLPKFSDGEGEGRLMAETAALLESKWALDGTQQGLEKTFKFPTYAKALVSYSLRH